MRNASLVPRAFDSGSARPACLGAQARHGALESVGHQALDRVARPLEHSLHFLLPLAREIGEHKFLPVVGDRLLPDAEPDARDLAGPARLEDRFQPMLAARRTTR